MITINVETWNSTYIIIYYNFFFPKWLFLTQTMSILELYYLKVTIIGGGDNHNNNNARWDWGVQCREDNLIPCRNLRRYRNTSISYRFKYQTYQSCFSHTSIYTGFRPVNGYRTSTKLHTKCFFPSPHANHTFYLPSFLTLLYTNDEVMPFGGERWQQ